MARAELTEALALALADDLADVLCCSPRRLMGRLPEGPAAMLHQLLVERGDWPAWTEQGETG